MKRLRIFLLLALSILLVLSFAIGCSGQKSANDEMSAPAENQDSGAPVTSDSLESSSLEPEKVITTIYLSFETTEFDNTNEKLNQIIEKHKSYVENSNISYNHYGYNKSYKYGNFIIRVPKENILAFKADLNGIGNMISESTDKQDVTKHYRDTESRLKVITVKETRILALLEKSEKIEDIIALENQLSELIYEKENLQSSLINIDDKVDFSTIHLDIQEVERLSNAETIETTFGMKVKNAFNDSFFKFKKAMENFLIWLIYAIPFIIIFGILGYGAYRIIKYIVIKRKNKS